MDENERNSRGSEYEKVQTPPQVSSAGADPATVKSFKEFWPLYLSQHSNPKTRMWHYAGTLLGVFTFSLVFGFQYARNSGLEALILALFAQVVATYGVLFASHWIIEGNQPVVLNSVGKQKSQLFKEMYWAALGNFRILWLALNERVAEEYRTNNLSSK